MQKRVDSTQCTQFIAPLFPHRLGDICHGRGGVARGQIRRVIKFGQRAGKIACPVIFIPLRHALTLVGTPRNQGNHSDAPFSGVGVVPLGYETGTTIRLGSLDPNLDVATTVTVHFVAPGIFVKTADVPVTVFFRVFFPFFRVTVYFVTGFPPL